MKKYIVSVGALLAILSLVISFSISIQPIQAQTVNCPAGYTCTPIAPQPTGCPAGYMCTPTNTSLSSPTSTATPTECYTIPANLYLGSTGQNVVALQTWLIANGYDIRNISLGLTARGYYGTQTAGAVARYLASQKYKNCANPQTYQPTSIPTPAPAPASTSTFTITSPSIPACPAGQTWTGSMCQIASASQYYVTIQSPNGGEQYTQGQTVPISFSTNLTSQQSPNGFNIFMYYGGNSTNAGMFSSGVQMIVLGYRGSSPYNWTIPSSMAAGNYVAYIVPAQLVSGITNTGLFDFGNNYFTIRAGTTTNCPSGQTWNGSACVSSNQPVTVAVQSPTSGQTFTTGSTIPITWTSNGASSLTTTILFERFDDSANSGSPVTAKTITTTNSGSYNLALGSGDLNTLFPCPNGCTSTNGTASFDVRVIISVSGIPNSTSGRFTITGSSATQPTVTITAPNGGTFQAGTPVVIQWTATGITPQNNSLGLAVYQTSLGSTRSLLSTTVSNTGSYTWTIPAAAPSGTDYVVYMSTSNTWKQSNPFRIIPQVVIPSITITSPNGGESYLVGANVVIKWDATSVGRNINYVFLRDYTTGVGGRDYVASVGDNIIYSNDNGSGQITWAIPANVPEGKYKIVVGSSGAGVDTWDFSDTTFSIYRP